MCLTIIPFCSNDYMLGLPDVSRFYWIGAGIGAIVVVVISIVVVVVIVAIVFKQRSRQTHYVRVNSNNGVN